MEAGQVGPPLPAVAGPAALQRRIQGLLLYRLLMAVFFLTLTLLCEFRGREAPASSPLGPLYVFSAVLFVFTIVGVVSLRRVRRLETFAYAQLFFDVAAVTAVILLTGGVDSPFSFLYMPVIIGAAVLTQRRGSLWIASATCLAYGLVVDLQYFGWIKPYAYFVDGTPAHDSGAFFYALVMHMAAFFLVAFLSGYLAEELQKSNREVKRQKRDLCRIEALYRSIVTRMGSGLLGLATDGTVQYGNRAAEEILGRPLGTFIGRHVSEIFPPLGADVETKVEPEETGTSSRGKELRYDAPDGRCAHLAYTLSKLQPDEGENGPEGWILIFQDQTAYKAMEEHLRRLEQLAFAGKMAAEVVHEIKNPLAAISGAVQILQADLEDDPLKARLGEILTREIDRVNELVSQFLWLAREPQKAGFKESVAVAEAIQDVLAGLEREGRVLPQHRVNVAVGPDECVVINRSHFRRVLTNVLLNSLESMPGEGTVTIRSIREGSRENGTAFLRLDVQDSGTGIARDATDRIFEPFFTTKESGLGLGLSIVYRLMETAGGRAEVRGTSPRGTCFSLLFPLS